jgi:transcriptional regulator with XRE-family HTH domain
MLNKILRQLRKEAKLTQGELAEKLNIPLTTYANWEQGTRQPGYDILLSLANIYSCSVDFILGRTSNPSETLKSPNADEALVILSNDAKIPVEKLKELVDYLKYQNKKD